MIKWLISSMRPILKRYRVTRYGLKSYLTYFVMQRIFRINSHVPWMVHWSTIISHPERIKMQIDGIGFLPGGYFQAVNGIIIGKNLRVGPGVKIISANHNIYDYSVHDPADPIKIGDNCWLGANSVILPGVELGDHTIVAAGAVVSKSFPEGNCVLGGVPARIIKKIADYGKKENPINNTKGR